MDKHIIFKLSSLEINEQEIIRAVGTKVEEKEKEDAIVEVTMKWEDPYYEVLWLTGC